MLVHSPLIYAYETLPLKIYDIYRLPVFTDQALFVYVRNIEQFGQGVRCTILDKDDKLVGEIHFLRLKWFEYVLRVNNHYPSRQSMLAGVGVG